MIPHNFYITTAHTAEANERELSPGEPYNVHFWPFWQLRGVRGCAAASKTKLNEGRSRPFFFERWDSVVNAVQLPPRWFLFSVILIRSKWLLSCSIMFSSGRRWSDSGIVSCGNQAKCAQCWRSKSALEFGRLDEKRRNDFWRASNTSGLAKEEKKNHGWQQKHSGGRPGEALQPAGTGAEPAEHHQG